MKSMSLSNLCFFYHCGPNERQVVGVIQVSRRWCKTREKEGAVDVWAVRLMRQPVSLKEMKEEEGLKGFVLFKKPPSFLFQIALVFFNISS
ncbi:thymocyte nuclear protein 1-like protein [Cinnamomum micranthum f. kanehirae]|uniref:Thymocyte nuclear protein 1-like protein n=1 Tax=Cinnamomum micranthum f. kanehirae TaxID=337451 RepID=A0A443PRS8_9MAGN|nr:thymocyte nuclear protein 1-like protein [Cinnamomum micranthum f. kanehirae]